MKIPLLWPLFPRRIDCKPWQENHGFTLVELVLAMTLSSLIFSAVSGIIFAGILTWQKGEVEMDTRYNIANALERMLQETREAAALIPPGNSGMITDYLDLQVPNNTLSATTVVRYGFDQAGWEIQRNFQPIASKITGLAVDYADFPPLIRIRITGRGFQGREIAVQGTAVMRSQIQ